MYVNLATNGYVQWFDPNVHANIVDVDDDRLKILSSTFIIDLVVFDFVISHCHQQPLQFFSTNNNNNNLPIFRIPCDLP